MILVNALVVVTDPALPVVGLRAERRTLAKRLWRGTAADGTEFGFELSAPLNSGDTVHQTVAVRYVIVQEPEPVLEILLGDLPPSAAAGIGWAVGNLHLEFASAARQLFARIQVDYTPTTAVFRPGRFKRSVATSLVDELGSSHKH